MMENKDSEKQKDCADEQKSVQTFTAKSHEKDNEQHDRFNFGTQRIYKKTSANSALTLYLPSREIILAGSLPTKLRGVVFADPKSVQGYLVYSQLTLTFRYGREDEEVLGLKFCNEAIMSLHKVCPRTEYPETYSLSPLQEALVRRLGDGAYPFTLTLTSQAPPSVQLVPAKRYYGAPIGTSYDVRCFIAEKKDENLLHHAMVKMSVRVIYRTDVFHHSNRSENADAQINSQAAAPPTLPGGTSAAPAAIHSSCGNQSTPPTGGNGSGSGNQPRKSGSTDSITKQDVSPKAFGFSGRFGRSKSESEHGLHEYDCSSGGGPQGAVDKPFLLQDGRVSLRASLDKTWYTHGEDVCVTVNIRNDSRKTVRKVRVSAIQHVDVCMFNNGKFKNVVADSDLSSPDDRTVMPGGTFDATTVLKPQRGSIKDWIALENTLVGSSESDQITSVIAASATLSPNLPMSPGNSFQPHTTPAVGIPHPAYFYGDGYRHLVGALGSSGGRGGRRGSFGDDRNVFAIYVSYYVKVKLTLSSMGGDLSLKLPFLLVHVDETQRAAASELRMEKLSLDDLPTNEKNEESAKINAERDLKSVEDGLLPITQSASAENQAMTGGGDNQPLVRSESTTGDLNEAI